MNLVDYCFAASDARQGEDEIEKSSALSGAAW